ncbi:MAG: fimbria/pilus outer membrane usher protein [Pseudomonadota bacterium]
MRRFSLRLSFIAGLLLLVPTIGGVLQAAVPEPYSVSVDGKRYKFVYLLAVGSRLAVSEGDLTHWGIRDFAGNQAAIPGLAVNLRLFWLDEIDTFDLQFDRNAKKVTLKRSADSRQNQLSLQENTAQIVRLERGWGTDVTYRAAVFSQPGDSPLSQVQGKLGFSMGQFGRLSTVVDADNHTDLLVSESSARRWQYRLRDTSFHRDFDSGYQLRVGQLDSNRAGMTKGFSMLGVSVDTNVLGRARVSLSNRLSGFEDVVTLQQPAELEVRVNGQLVASRSVGVGRLSVYNIPIGTGANNIELLLRYADGSVQTFERQVIGGSELIGEGLSETSVALGVLEDGDAVERFSRYDAPYAALSFAHGVTGNQTAIVNAEVRGGDERYRAIQAEWVGRLPDNIIARASGSWSNARADSDTPVVISGEITAGTGQPLDRSGFQSEVSLEFARQRSSLFFGGNYSDEDYLTLRQNGFATNPRFRGWLNWQLSLPGSRGVSAFYRYQHNHDATVQQSLTASYRARIGTAQLNVSLGYDDRDTGGGLHASVMATMPFHAGANRLTTFSRSNAQSRQVSTRLGRSLASNATGSGWSAHLQQTAYEAGGQQTTGGFSGIYRGQFAEARLNTRYAGDEWYFSGEAQGSLVFAENNLYVSRPVGTSFAVIDTGDGAGATVSANHRRAATVDNKGKAFLPMVQSYSPLTIGIDANSLTSDMISNSITKNVAFAPGFALVSIPIRQSLHATGIFVDGVGEPWPPGTEIRTRAGSADTEVRGFVGKLGQAYLMDLNSNESLVLVAGENTCVFDLPLPDDNSAGLVDFGTYRCDF